MLFDAVACSAFCLDSISALFNVSKRVLSSCASSSKRLVCLFLPLNTLAAFARLPISSLRVMPGMLETLSPSESLLNTWVIERIGPSILCTVNTAPARASRTAISENNSPFRCVVSATENVSCAIDFVWDVTWLANSPLRYKNSLAEPAITTLTKNKFPWVICVSVKKSSSAFSSR